MTRATKAEASSVIICETLLTDKVYKAAFFLRNVAQVVTINAYVHTRNYLLCLKLLVVTHKTRLGILNGQIMREN